MGEIVSLSDIRLERDAPSDSGEVRHQSPPCGAQPVRRVVLAVTLPRPLWAADFVLMFT